jgi:hypothetical protein
MSFDATSNRTTTHLKRSHDDSKLMSLYPPSPYGKVAVEKNGCWSLKQRVLISKVARARMSETQSFLLTQSSRNRCKDVPRFAEPVAVRQTAQKHLLWFANKYPQLSYQVAVKLSDIVPGELGAFTST